MYKYKTLAVKSGSEIQKLNTLYEDGWEFVNSIAEFVSISTASINGASVTGYVYFTIRKALP